MKKPILLLSLMVAGALTIFGQSPFTVWNFNSNPPDGDNTTGSLKPSVGTGTVTLIGGVSSTFASGSAGGGSSDTASVDNTALNISSFPAQSTNSGSAGVYFEVSTSGKRNIVLSWDARHSNTATRWYQLQYTIDGNNFVHFDGEGTDTAGLYRTLAGDTWNKGKKAHLKGIPGVDNNPNFGFRLVSVFEPGLSAYTAARSTSNYSANGTFRLDMVSVKEDLSVSFQILHGSDFEAGLFAPVDAPGFAAIADSFSRTHPLTLKLSSGDNFIPSPFLYSGEDPSLVAPLRKAVSQYFDGPVNNMRVAIGRPDIAILNLIGLDASCLGNHEFDLGSSELNSIIGPNIASGQIRWAGAQFPYLSANLDFSGDPNLSYLYENNPISSSSFKTPSNISSPNQKKGLAPYTIIEKGGERFGVIGATTPMLQRISSPGDTKVKNPGANTEDMELLAGILQPYVDTLRTIHGINKIILLAHLQQLKNEEELATKLEGVDILIAGGNHTLCADGNDVLKAGDVAEREYPIMAVAKDNKPCVILNTAAEYKYIGRFVATFDENGDLDLQSFDSTINGSYTTDTNYLKQVFGSLDAAYQYSPKVAAVKELCDSIASVILRKDGLIYGKSKVFLEGRRSFVRTRETNLGNLSADANLWKARSIDPEVMVSLKNGGGIRSAIGEVFTVGSTTNLLPPQANPFSGKKEGDISQLDLENAMRFNNRISIVSVTAEKLAELFEHGVAATFPGATPGRFPQIGGARFSFDPSLPAGSRIRNFAIVNEQNVHIDSIIANGVLIGDPQRVIKLVTLNFLANGGDGYPFPTTVNHLSFGEQEVLAEYLSVFHQTDETAFNSADVDLPENTRIQQLNVRNDEVYTSLGDFRLLSPADGTVLVTESTNQTQVSPTWTSSIRAEQYMFELDAANADFTQPLLVLPSSNASRDTFLTLTVAQIDMVLNSLGVKQGDTIAAKWRVKAINAQKTDSAYTQPFSIVFIRKTDNTSHVDISTNEHAWVVYPNPAGSSSNGWLHVVGNGYYSVEIYDATGKKCLKTQAQGHLMIPTHDLSTGMYLITLRDSDGRVSTQRLLID
jgi:2',3'-cyclic-nucleotide 2'-phosphodiesterase (5'-nucleotidase family)